VAVRPHLLRGFVASLRQRTGGRSRSRGWRMPVAGRRL